MVELRKITRDNFEEIVNLKVTENQSAFVSTVSHSLAQAWLYRNTAFPFAIYANNTPVGFVMLGYYEERNQYTLWKFLIDEKYQNNGYGKQALTLAVNYLSSKFNANEVYVGVSDKNETAKHLYMSFGFKPTGKTENGTEELKYICKH
ncbi:MAG: GNAT family N-acetyltransferase [Clostridia bacterium]|nr:GNAT family N-acetyltransferase [Clostridia bacterium]